VPAYLRADLGLPPVAEPVLWHSLPTTTTVVSLRRRSRH
jgi:hypothetical protein